MSMRLPDLARWPLPPMEGARSADTVAVLSPIEHVFRELHLHDDMMDGCMHMGISCRQHRIREIIPSLDKSVILCVCLYDCLLFALTNANAIVLVSFLMCVMQP